MLELKSSNDSMMTVCAPSRCRWYICRHRKDPPFLGISLYGAPCIKLERFEDH